MYKKILSLFFILIFIYFIESFLNFAYATADVFQGHAETTNSAQSQNELFTGAIKKLDRNEILIMTVSQVLDTNLSKKGSEFFAEVTNDVEGNSGILIPSGTIAHGKIKQIVSAKRLGQEGALDLYFDYLITPDGREIPIKGKMSTRLHPALATSKIVATDLGYTTVGGVTGGLLALVGLGLGPAITTQGCTVAGGAAVGSTVGLGISLYRKGKDVLISPGDEIRVKINTSMPLPVYKKTAFFQHELNQEGLDIKINDILYEKDPFGEVNIIKLFLTISNNTKITFSIFDLALVNNYNTAFYPAVFSDTTSMFSELKPGDTATGSISYSVDNIKNKFNLIFYDNKRKKVVAEISLNNAYRDISDKSKNQNKKIMNNKTDFYKDYNPFNDE